jgi:hypothetical protein
LRVWNWFTSLYIWFFTNKIKEIDTANVSIDNPCFWGTKKRLLTRVFPKNYAKSLVTSKWFKARQIYLPVYWLWKVQHLSFNIHRPYFIYGITVWTIGPQGT